MKKHPLASEPSMKSQASPPENDALADDTSNVYMLDQGRSMSPAVLLLDHKHLVAMCLFTHLLHLET